MSEGHLFTLAQIQIWASSINQKYVHNYNTRYAINQNFV